MVDPDDALPAHIVEAKTRAQDLYLAVVLLCTVDIGRAVGRVLQELSNDSLKGKSKFLATLAKALAMFNNYSYTAPEAQPTSGYEGVAFVQDAARATMSTKKRGKETSDVGTPT